MDWEGDDGTVERFEVEALFQWGEVRKVDTAPIGMFGGKEGVTGEGALCIDAAAVAAAGADHRALDAEESRKSFLPARASR